MKIWLTLVALAAAHSIITTAASPVIEREIVNNAAPCGVPAIEPFPPVERTVGGIEAKPNSWPWMCAFGRNSSQHGTSNWQFLCGCSVLNEVTLLTAAECVRHSTAKQNENARSDYWVRCGIHYIKGHSNPHEQTVLVANMTYHELLNTTTLDYDVGILKLSTPLTFNDFVSPVCLPQKDVEPGTKSVVTGWGDPSEDYRELRQVTLPVVSHDECVKDYENETFLSITDRMLCAGGYDDGKGVCFGDTGGPLVIKRDGVWEIQGLTSWINVPCGEKGYMNIFTHVITLVDWIKQRL